MTATRHRWVVLATGVALLLGASVARSAACLLVLAPAAKVSVGAVEFTHHVRADPCTGIRVVTGTVTACYRTSDGSKRCDELRSGVSFAIDGAGRPNADPSFAGVLFAMLKGDQRTMTGLVRAPPDYPAIAGLPYGDISVTAGELTLQIPGLGEFALFDADGAGPALMRTGNAGGRVPLPQRDLQPGRKLRWVARVNGREYQGRLHVIAAADEREVSSRLQVSAHQAAPRGAAWLRAETLDELGLYFQRDQVVRAANIK
ncbi:MAG: hypothetical protein ABI920_06330 [Casimicrobiaceae bacterium]